MADNALLQAIQEDIQSKANNTSSATENVTPELPQEGQSTPTTDVTPEVPQNVQSTTNPNVSPELAQAIKQDVRPDADKLQEAGEASVTGAGDLPNPFAPQDTTDTQRFNQAVASAEITGATPEEIQKQILVDHPNWQPVQRKVSQEEKDSGLWGTRWLTADTEYGIKLPDGTIWSINKPKLSWGDIRSTTVQEVPYAIATALTGGATMAVRALRTALAMGGVNVGQQASNVVQGGRDVINPIETTMVAGASGLAEPVIKTSAWGLRKIGQGLGYIAPVIPKTTNNARKAVNNILAKNGGEPEVAVYTPEQLKKLQEEAFERQINRDIFQTGVMDANLENVMANQTTNPYYREMTSDQFKKELDKVASDTAKGFENVELITDIPLTGSEVAFDPTRGPTRQHQIEATKRIMDEEKRLAGVEGSALEGTLDIRNERIADLLTQEEGLLSGGGRVRALELRKTKLNRRIFNLKNAIDEKTTDLEKAPLKEELKPLEDELNFVEQELNNIKPPMTVEETGENVVDSLKTAEDVWSKFAKFFYDEAKEIGKNVNMSVFEKSLIPYDIQLSNTPTVRKVYEQFVKMLKSDDTFTMMPDGTQKSALRPRTLDEINIARRYLRDSISELKKDGATFHEGEQLQKVYDKFMENIENLQKEHAPDRDLVGEALRKIHGDDIENYFSSLRRGDKQYRINKELWGDKEFLGKVLNRIDKGDITPKQLLSMFLSSTGEPKIGQQVVDKLNQLPEVKDSVKEALLFSLLVEPSATGISGKNIRLGQTLIPRWDRIKNNTQIQALFGDEWEKVKEAMDVLTKVDVARREARVNSATADRSVSMLDAFRDSLSNSTITGKLMSKMFSNVEGGFKDIADQKAIQKTLVEMADKYNRPVVIRGKKSPTRNVASTGAVLESNEEENE